MNPAWKVDRIKIIDDEVGVLHPLLRDLFPKLPHVVHVEYKQGPREKGADFVITKDDPTLQVNEYVGVIVKTDQIRQDHEDVRRQIRECNYPREIEGGKKTIRPSEIWIVTSKTISANAQETISNEWQSSKFKFIDCDKLVSLIDKWYPDFWKYANAQVSGYVSEQRKKIESHATLHSLQSVQINHVEVDQQIQQAPEGNGRSFRVRKPKASRLIDQLTHKNFIFIEGQMGAGKSELVRSCALKMCEERTLQPLIDMGANGLSNAAEKPQTGGFVLHGFLVHSPSPGRFEDLHAPCGLGQKALVISTVAQALDRYG